MWAKCLAQQLGKDIRFGLCELGRKLHNRHRGNPAGGDTFQPLGQTSQRRWFVSSQDVLRVRGKYRCRRDTMQLTGISHDTVEQCLMAHMHAVEGPQCHRQWLCPPATQIQAHVLQGTVNVHSH